MKKPIRVKFHKKGEKIDFNKIKTKPVKIEFSIGKKRKCKLLQK